MKHQDRQSTYETLERQLLALYHSGIYLSSYDIVVVGKEVGYDLPLKERDILLRKLIGEAKKDGNLVLLLERLSMLVAKRASLYRTLGNSHPYARGLISSWIQKAKSTDLLLKREIKEVQNG